MKAQFVLMTALACFLSPLNSAEFSVPLLSKVPAMDGVIQEEEWKDAIAFSGAPNGELRKETFYLGYRPEGLYAAVRSELPPRGDLATLGRNLVLDDSLELWFVPPLENRIPGPLAQGKFQYIVTHNGKSFSRQHAPGYGLAARDWNCGTPAKMSKHDGWWDVEFFFPASVFGLKELDASDWRMFFGRNFAILPARQVRYTDAGNDFMRTDLFSSFHLNPETCGVQQGYSTGKRIPLQFTTSGKQTLSAEVTVNGEKTVFTLQSGTLKEVTASGKCDVEFVIRNAKGQIVMKRSFSVEKEPEQLWQNMESFAIFHHDFSHGWTTPDYFNGKEPVSLTVKSGTPLAVEGREEGHNALRLPPGTSLLLKNVKPQNPGAIQLWLRPSGSLLQKPSRYFGTANPPSRYLFYQESLLLGSPYFHFGIHNLIPPLSNQYNLTARSTSLIPEEWNSVIVNLKPQGVEYYLNGVNIANKPADFTGNETFGDFVLGGSSGSITLDVASVTIYRRPLTAEEITASLLTKGSIEGELAFYVGQNAVILNAALDGKKYKTLEVDITDNRRESIFKQQMEVQPPVPGKRYFQFRRKIILPKRLPEGNYLLVLREPGKKRALLEKRFENRNFPWLNNSIGKRQCILPGFEPVRRDGRTISVVLRDYQIGENGLPEQITAEGKKILASPIALYTIKNGKRQDLQSGKFQSGVESDYAAEYHAKLRNDLLAATIQGRMEQDGLLRLDLTLSATGKQMPDQIVFDIPVRKEIAQLFHAAGEGIRANPAGFLPEGTGCIWGSRSIPQIKISNFIPYCWVGTDRAGIAYAADWDQGWVHCTERDAVELHRNPDGTVLIRLNLLNKPVKIDSNRIITLILMASPVKKMPENRRNWCDGFPFKAERNAQCFYSGAYWGQYFSDQGRYPAFQDFTYIRKLVETLTTGKVDQKFRTQWLDRIRKAQKADAPLISQRPPNYLTNHFDAAHGKMLALHGCKNPVVYCYTCNYFPVDALPEARFFKDEWRDMHVYGSFADYALYYFDKMLEAGLNGIYNDNTYMVGNYDWTAGNAWEDDNGVLHPSMGIWREREYFRRQYVAMLDRGIKEPWITVHHTNSNVLPALGFATNTMGMEWKYGITDFQTRFSSDYIRAVCQGQQGGFYPTVLDGIPYEGTAEQRSWCTRTMLAALLPHEIHPTAHRNSDAKVYEKIHNILLAFGIGKTDCKATLFWEKENPVQTDSESLLVTSYQRGDKLLLICGNYGETVKTTLHFPGPVRQAVNAETGEKLEIRDNAVILPILKHDIAIVEAVRQ